MVGHDVLAERFRAAGADHGVRAPFHGRLTTSIADEPELIELLRAAPDDQQLPVLLMAAVHYLVLSEPDVPLGRWYPTVSTEPLTGDAFPVFRAFCLERADEIRSLLATRSTQTNEVGRCGVFLRALAFVADEVGPLGLVDVGTSGGLNLRLRHYHYRYEPGGAVGARSEVSLTTATRGAVPVPAELPPVSARIGIDQDPIDVTDPDEARWLQACVWPDQLDRFARLAAAIRIAAEDPVELRRADAVDGLAGTVGDVAAAAHPVVLNSWVLNYLSERRRVDYLVELDRIGSEIDLTWLFLESPALCPGLPFPDEIADQRISATMLVRWRNGRRTVEHLADAHPHGFWLHWR
jgi:hypothetical protein